MTSKVNYLGELRTEAIHLKSNTVIHSDAPTDNQGKGEKFSPTDLVATALAQCLLTIMGIKARDMDIDISGSSANVLKAMASKPRKIDSITIEVTMKGGCSDKEKTILERAALTCPVALTLHDTVQQDIRFHWEN
jgi:uncharacterized OsmC-like protein